MASPNPTKITLIGAGTIGLSFAALHLTKDPQIQVTIYDTRPDLASYVSTHLPSYLIDTTDPSACTSRLHFASDLASAVRSADIIQEQGPENLNFKTKIWQDVESLAPAHALFWSSTSGIPASLQSELLKDKSRVLIVHPYNPPHIMPLLEIVRSPTNSEEVLSRTLTYWRNLGRVPIIIQKECVGFVANRLASALFREACSLVTQGVVGVKDLDEIVKASMGPRWAVEGPFEAYHAGGGEGGLKSMLEKLGGTVQKCWDAEEEDVKKGGIVIGGKWQEDVCKQTEEAFGFVDTDERDRKMKEVLKAAAA